MPTSGACPVSSGRASSCDSVSTSPSNGSRDRKSTRLNSSHITNSYAVFCSKKKRLRLRRARLSGSPEVRRIGQIVKLRPELQLHSFLDGKHPRNTEVSVPDTRISHDVACHG